MRRICMIAALLCATPTQAHEVCTDLYANDDFTFVVYSDADTLRFNGEILGMRGCGTGLNCSFRLNEKGQKVPAEFYYDGTSIDDAMVYIHPSLGEIRLKLICPKSSDPTFKVLRFARLGTTSRVPGHWTQNRDDIVVELVIRDCRTERYATIALPELHTAEITVTLCFCSFYIEIRERKPIDDRKQMKE